MKTKLLRELFKRHQLNNIDFSQDSVEVTLRPIDPDQLRIEGVPIPEESGKKDAYYHNYTYAEGFIRGLDSITIERSTEDRTRGRVSTIRLPKDLLGNVQELVDGMVYLDSNEPLHTVAFEGDEAVIHVDCQKSMSDERLLDQLISALQPRLASTADIAENINYVSDFGRLAPLINLATIAEAKKKLLGQSHNLLLLQWKDSSRESQTLSIPRNVLDAYMEKCVREEGLLATLVKNHLEYDKKNWLSPDLYFFKAYQRWQKSSSPQSSSLSADSQKLHDAITLRRKPLYLTTTTGQHAFAIKVDFAQNTLFVANPSGDYSCFAEIMSIIKEITGCVNVILVNNQLLTRERSQDLPFNDTCTIDALVLTDVMMRTAALSEGCLNDTLLTTTSVVEQALDSQPAPSATQSSASSASQSSSSSSLTALSSGSLPSAPVFASSSSAPAVSATSAASISLTDLEPSTVSVADPWAHHVAVAQRLNTFLNELAGTNLLGFDVSPRQSEFLDLCDLVLKTFLAFSPSDEQKAGLRAYFDELISTAYQNQVNNFFPITLNIYKDKLPRPSALYTAPASASSSLPASSNEAQPSAPPLQPSSSAPLVARMPEKKFSPDRSLKISLVQLIQSLAHLTTSHTDKEEMGAQFEQLFNLASRDINTFTVALSDVIANIYRISHRYVANGTTSSQSTVMQNTVRTLTRYGELLTSEHQQSLIATMESYHTFQAILLLQRSVDVDLDAELADIFDGNQSAMVVSPSATSGAFAPAHSVSASLRATGSSDKVSLAKLREAAFMSIRTQCSTIIQQQNAEAKSIFAGLQPEAIKVKLLKRDFLTIFLALTDVGNSHTTMNSYARLSQDWFMTAINEAVSQTMQNNQIGYNVASKAILTDDRSRTARILQCINGIARADVSQLQAIITKPGSRH